ncbi:MAG: hypothetical protein JW891_16040 [Candidatus Lokiarchaeota archaeon]|nr:hypothetical protein [Candidatus Lokiarchaeota archaeon]
MTSNFKNLGPMLDETRTTAVCEICHNYIYKRVYMLLDEGKNKTKTVFVCKTCLENGV